MKNFFMLLLLSGVVGSFASILSDGSVLGKYVKYIASLICVLVIVSPLSGTISEIDIGEPNFSIDDISTDLEDTAIAMTEAQIKNKIIEKFGIIPKAVNIEIDENVTIKVTLEDKDLSYKQKVDEYVKGLQ